jgi:hypothetical protein
MRRKVISFTYSKFFAGHIFASGFLVQVYIYTHQLCLATFDSKRQRSMMYIDHPAMGFVCL